jgi:hypothetical protein
VNLEFRFENPSHSWSVLHVFKLFFDEVSNTKKFKIDYKNSAFGSDRFAGGLNSAHVMSIKNLDNGKYILVSYWDNCSDLLNPHNGWDVKNCVEIISSAGIRENKVTPFSYLTYSTDFESLHPHSKVISSKTKNELIFRGHLYGDRMLLKDLGIINITNEKITPNQKYFEDLTDNKICLSLDGAGEICNRDIEIFSAKSVLLRPKLTFDFYNKLIPEYHYISFERNNNPKIQSEIILEKYNEIKDNDELLHFVSTNGYNWFLENGTIRSNVDILHKLIDFNKLV